jgi:peptidoglycan hydrolase-like protein with peptidoglycan-binding domain
VIAFQEEFGLPINGRVGAITWAAIADIYEDIAGGAELAEGQYPGTELGR